MRGVFPILKASGMNASAIQELSELEQHRVKASFGASDEFGAGYRLALLEINRVADANYLLRLESA